MKSKPHQSEPRLVEPHAFRGRLEALSLDSELLAQNPLGDPSQRDVAVWSPAESSNPLPLVLVLAGFTGRGQKYLDTHPWHPGLALRLDRAHANGEFPACRVAFPDCFTALGGSQYLDSSAVGKYQSHLFDEIVPFIEERWPCIPSARGVVGKSSGGFGALRLALARPGYFSAVGSLSGDCGFELAYGAELLSACRGLIPWGGDAERFLKAFHQRPDLSGDGHAVIDVLAMSACYAPNPEAPLGFDLPMDPHTGERQNPGWDRWLENDPLTMIEQDATGFAALNYLDLVAGTKDEFHLQFSLRRLCARLKELNISHQHTEFDGGHFGTDEELLGLTGRVAKALA